MQLTALVRGSNLVDMLANANALCVNFYGTRPYEIPSQDWDTANVEWDPEGNFVCFNFSMTARPKP